MQLADGRERYVPRFLLILVSTAWHAGRHEIARVPARRLREVCPDLTLRELRRWPLDDDSLARCGHGRRQLAQIDLVKLGNGT